MAVLKVLVTTAVILAAVFFGYQKFSASTIGKILTSPSPPETSVPSDSSLGNALSEASPEQTLSESQEAIALEPTHANTPSDIGINEQALDADDASSVSSQAYPPLAAYDIGHEILSEEEFAAMVIRLKNDPELLIALTDELRAETNKDRSDYLVRILGATESSAVLPVAEEMISSGIDGSRAAGLNLLSRIAPKNPDALVVASNLMLSETEPDVLMAAINVVAQPGDAPAEVRDALATQVSSLTTHESPELRGLSISTLSRLSDDPNLEPVFYSALYDEVPSVRSSGVYALANVSAPSVEAVQKLMDMVEDANENTDVRRAAIFALSSQKPDELTKQRLDAADLQIRREIRQKRINGN